MDPPPCLRAVGHFQKLATKELATEVLEAEKAEAFALGIGRVDDTVAISRQDKNIAIALEPAASFNPEAGESVTAMQPHFIGGRFDKGHHIAGVLLGVKLSGVGGGSLGHFSRHGGAPNHAAAQQEDQAQGWCPGPWLAPQEC